MLRKLVSYSVRIENITLNEISEMAEIGKSLSKYCCLYDTHISPSMRVFCNVALSHCKQLFNTFKLGLSINTMEGHEQKLQMVEKYSQNSTFQERWTFFEHFSTRVHSIGLSKRKRI